MKYLQKKQLYESPDSKIRVDVKWTKYLLVTHPVEFITTVRTVKGKAFPNVAPFATCLDTSYEPPHVTFAAALKQHAIQGQEQTNSKMNTYLNIRQNKTFVVNIPDKSLLNVLDIIASPHKREELNDKLKEAGLTKLCPFVLPKNNKIYPPLIKECLAHLECELVDIHRPKKSDHYLITGKVVGASYDMDLGDISECDSIREQIARKTFHHFGARYEDPTLRNIGYIQPELIKAITFKLEEKVKV